jgi:hypothetical protein
MFTSLTGGRIKLVRAVLPWTVIVLVTAIPALAQQSQGEEEELIKPSRPDLADPAEFHRPGVLQVEYGFDANFRAEEFRDQQRTPLTLRFAASRRLLLQLDLDAVISERGEETRRRETGVGDTRLGAQVLAAEDGEGHPALAFAYFVKLPSANEDKQLGTGRFDHRVVALVSKKVGDTDVDFNVAYLNVGREDSGRRASGGQAALSFTRELNDKFGLVAEVAGQSEEDVLPRGIYPLGAFTVKVSERVQFDGGVRFGIGAEAPRVGVFAGITVGVGKRR